MSAPPLADAEARRAIREDLGATLVVEAAAGTGKTTEMIARIIAVIRSGASRLEQIVAVTFTEKAAGEMKLRLRTELERARQAAASDDAVRLQAALGELEVARIGSIHSFCADLLRERPIEARIDPLFEVAAEDDSERIYAEAFERWLQTTLDAPGDGVRRMLRRKEPTEQLRRAGWALVDRRDFTGAWRRDEFDRDAAIDAVLQELAGFAALGDLAADPRDKLAALCHKLDRWLAELGRREAVRARDHDGLEAELADVKRWWEWKQTGGRSQHYGKDLLRVDVVLRRDAARGALEAFLRAADADLAARLHNELRPLVTSYEDAKARSGRLDFLDLLAKTRDLLRDDPRVRSEMQQRFTHFFVDEFQDTDPLQVEILMLLCADNPACADPTHARPVPGKLFVVGDPKQAIYRFRRADITLYQAVKQRLVADGARLLYLTTSFRGVPAIQSAINAAFAPVMQGNGQADYVPLEPSRTDAPAPQPAVIALPVPRPYGKWGVSGYAIEESYPDAVAAFVDELVHKTPWEVTERGADRRVRVEARHVCLMFRRFQSYGRDLTRPYVRALEARGIPHVLMGGRSFHEREEIAAARNALSAIEWPGDELAVYATLKGPFFAFHDEDLIAFRHAHHRLHPLAWLDPARRAALAQPLETPAASASQVPTAQTSLPIAGIPDPRAAESSAPPTPVPQAASPAPSAERAAPTARPNGAVAPDNAADLNPAMSPPASPALPPAASPAPRTTAPPKSAVSEAGVQAQVAIAGALAILGELHQRRNRRPIADTLARLLAATRAHAGLAVWPAGEQALANLFRVMDLARRFETTGATSFRAFVERLESDAERGRQPDAPVVEDGTEGVRIMTVHAAKGLEFPVVILCDPTAPLSADRPSHYIDAERDVWLESLAGCVPSELREHEAEVLQHDREEGERLAYVAVTRARDLLVVPVVGDEERESWVQALDPVVFPDAAKKRKPEPMPGYAFGDDSVVERSSKTDRMPTDSVAPGIHRPRAGGHTVVWWDPNKLALDTQPGGGVRRPQILQADEANDNVAANAGIAAHAAWQQRRSSAIAAGARPTITVKTVTAAAELAAPAPGHEGVASSAAMKRTPPITETAPAPTSGDAAGNAAMSAPPSSAATSVATSAAPSAGLLSVRLETVAGKRAGRPRGKRFGSLVHAILAAVDLRGDADHVRRIGANHARLVGATPEERDAAIVAVLAALSHPLMLRAAEAADRGALRREVPVVVSNPDGLVEGVVDLAFEEAGAWTVIDFKTDAEIDHRRPIYEAQVRAYAHAIGVATQRPANPVLLIV